MEEEKYISDKLGRRNPFTVPEGYFEQLTTKVMGPVWWAAAAVCALFVSTAAWLVIPGESQQNQGHVAEVIQQSQPDDAFFDEAADYMMLDNQDIYACLASEY